MTNERMHLMKPVPGWVQGVWRRELLDRGAGAEDGDMTVIWIQTPTLYADIRIPKSRPAELGRKRPRRLTARHLAALGRQRGFAGWLEVERQICTWLRPIDFQPPAKSPDVGVMFRKQTLMMECGSHANYREDWRLLDSGAGRFLALCRGRREILVVAGSHFILASNRRRRKLPRGASMTALLRGASRTECDDCLNCEISYGRLRGRDGAWRVELSTAPWREGEDLFAGDIWTFDPARSIASQKSGGRGPARRWRIVSCSWPDRQLAGLFLQR